MITLNPITLPASKMLSTMTTLIGDIRFKDTLSTSNIVNELVDSCRIGKVDFGKGIVFTFKLDTQPTKDLTETSSAFTITKPNMAQETILIDSYKFVPISLSEILTQDSVLQSYSINEFFTFVMSLLEDTTNFNFFDITNEMYQSWVPGQATQTIAIDQIDTSALKGSDLTNALLWNSNNVAKTIRKTINNMKIKNNKFTDVKTYVDINDGSTKNVISCLREDDLKFVVNDKYYTDFLAESMAALFHSEKVGEMLPANKPVLLPEDAMSSSNKKTIGWLSDKNKFALADFYKVTLSIQDPSTLYQNTFYHYAYGAGVFKYAVGVKFIENTITQTP